MEGIRKFLLMGISVVVMSMPVYSQDSKEARKSEKVDSKEKATREKSETESARSSKDSAGSIKDRELRERGCGGGVKPYK